jgi:hypothetical protein
MVPGLGGAAVAANDRYVFVLRGNTLYRFSGANGGRMEMSEQVELPGPRRPIMIEGDAIPPNVSAPGRPNRGGGGVVRPRLETPPGGGVSIP